MSKNIMILFSFSIFLCTFIILSCINVPNQENIVGVWKGESKDETFIFKFYDNGTCVLIFRNNASDSSEEMHGNFEIDISKKPILLTIRNIPQLQHPLHIIIRFVGNDSLIVAYFSEHLKLRPLAFEENKTINLKRHDNSSNVSF